MYGTASSKLNPLVLAVAKHPISERNHQAFLTLYFHTLKSSVVEVSFSLFISCEEVEYELNILI